MDDLEREKFLSHKGAGPWSAESEQYDRGSLFKDSGPWAFTQQGEKNRYNVGTSIQTKEDPRWTPSLTTKPEKIDWPDQGDIVEDRTPVSDDHVPCGYWPGSLGRPPEFFTSLTYPLEVFDDFIVTEHLVLSGIFRAVLRSTEMLTEDVTITDHDVLVGFFKTVMRAYEYQEDVEITVHDVLTAVFRQALFHYDIGIENAEITDHSVLSGIFRVALIDYTYYPIEDVDITDHSVLGGYHNA
jgi:hypothetical protein